MSRTQTYDAERRVFAPIHAAIAKGKPVYAFPTFPTRVVRAAALRPGDVIADAVTGAALAVLGIGHPDAYTVVAYVRPADAPSPDATEKQRWTPRELVRRAVLTAPDTVADRAAPTVERTTP